MTLNAVVMAVVNVLLDYVLIFGKFGMPEMGIKGAAIASVIAEAASLVFFLVYTWAKIDLKKFGLNHWQRIDFSLLGRILSISCFTMVQYFLAMATWFVFFVAVERLGQRELAIANIVRSIYVVMLIPVSFCSIGFCAGRLLRKKKPATRNNNVFFMVSWLLKKGGL